MRPAFKDCVLDRFVARPVTGQSHPNHFAKNIFSARQVAHHQNLESQLCHRHPECSERCIDELLVLLGGGLVVQPGIDGVQVDGLVHLEESKMADDGGTSWILPVDHSAHVRLCICCHGILQCSIDLPPHRFHKNSICGGEKRGDLPMGDGCVRSTKM